MSGIEVSSAHQACRVWIGGIVADKKEILDYLRNRQKAAEIEAKVNGINLWVLLGAIGVIGWTLLSYLQVDLWSHREFAVYVLLCCESLYLFIWLCSPTSGIREELRYEHWRADDVESPFLILMEGLWLLLPPALHIAITGKNFGAAFIGLFGAGIVVMSIIAIVMRVIGRRTDTERFPKPKFTVSPKSDVTGDLVIGACFILVSGVQVSGMLSTASVPVDAVKVLALLVSLYLLVLVAIRRRRGSHSIQWTYELETDILVDAVSPDVALRRIEHRALGSRLQDVMNKFFDELDRKLEVFDVALRKSVASLDGINAIPTEYHVERRARVDAATLEAKSLLDQMLLDIQEFSKYLDALGEKKSDARVATAMEGLASRKDLYRDRIDSAKQGLSVVVESALAPK
ncbi:hypothetical protein [Rubrivivax sp. A210]|uniref:hypothetical protein n=1 Tax=Rubrivivax sp. A210 TaxID=2772301 RepID=UPI00191944AB|nr:hypothetical protein [Rubrivivax sp. A210]